MNHIPLYTLEGTLLYGDLKLNTLGVYNLIMSLENKGDNNRKSTDK